MLSSEPAMTSNCVLMKSTSAFPAYEALHLANKIFKHAQHVTGFFSHLSFHSKHTTCYCSKVSSGINHSSTEKVLSS